MGRHSPRDEHRAFLGRMFNEVARSAAQASRCARDAMCTMKREDLFIVCKANDDRDRACGVSVPQRWIAQL